MPLQLPILDDRNFEQLLTEAKRRIPVYTPEWTNFDVESDPGITIVELFAFLTESLLYRADRIPERNRFKFLQLLGVPLQQAAPASGLIVFRNERGPVAELRLPRGVVVAAGSVQFLTRDDVNVLPIEGQVYYKRRISAKDTRFEEFSAKYQAVLEAALSSEEGGDVIASPGGGSPAGSGANIELDFYETMPLPLPTASNPDPAVDLAGQETMDHALYIALLAPKNVAPADVREVIANRTISVGVVPALAGNVPALLPRSPFTSRQAVPELIYELPDATDPTATSATYARPRRLQQPDVLSEIGIVQLELPGADKLRTWAFSEPMLEGTGDFPPRIEDEKVRERLVTWLRVRLPVSNGQTTTNGNGQGAQPNGETGGGDFLGGGGNGTSNQPAVTAQGTQGGTLSASLSWVGINAARIEQAIPVVNEQLGTANGEPDQTYTLANVPIIEGSLLLEVEDLNETDQKFRWKAWLQTDDLLSRSRGRSRLHARSRIGPRALWRRRARAAANQRQPYPRHL